MEREFAGNNIFVSCKLAKPFKRTGLNILLFMSLVLLLRTLFSQICHRRVSRRRFPSLFQQFCPSGQPCAHPPCFQTELRAPLPTSGSNPIFANAQALTQ